MYANNAYIDLSDFKFLPGVIKSIRKLKKKGFLVLTGYGKEEKKKIGLLPKKFFSLKVLPSLKNIKINF